MNMVMQYLVPVLSIPGLMLSSTASSEVISSIGCSFTLSPMSTWGSTVTHKFRAPISSTETNDANYFERV